MPGRRRGQAWRYHPAYRRPRHFHAEPEVNLVVRGSATFAIGERSLQVQRGSVLWFPPGLDHYLVEASTDFDLFVVGFTPALLDAFAREHGSAPEFTRAPHRLRDGLISRCLEVLANAPNGPDDDAEHRLLSVLGELTAASDAARPSVGQRAAGLLLAMPNLNRDALARKLASNRGDVSRHFRQDHGLSLSDFRNRVYVLRLLRLIETGQRNLTRAALEAGFGSYSQCHRVVRSILGHAPSELLDTELCTALADRFDPLTIAR